MAPRFGSFFQYFYFHYLFKYKTIETHAHTFLPLNILAVGSVKALIYIKIHPILSVRPSVLFFNPLPINQFESQIYQWISLNMTEILRSF